ncbi:single Ig IL-1-related receptor [Puma concolor]|uniref:Single Ig IL-1-related receptor n=1 Tax=Puma concolor TaxID=9696 RepID=A0A6P6H6I0_PUMCO|nr:single Ig IL-1-related receptor [Puma concolor]
MAGVCDAAPNFLSPSGNQALEPALGSAVSLNCTAWVVSGPHCPLPSVQWLKDGLPPGNGSHCGLHEDSRIKANSSEVLVSSVLGVNLTSAEDYGVFTCSIRNVSSSSFTLWRAEPSADLLVNLSRCRRLIVVLSEAFLGRAWCSHSFREGLCRLLELTRRPIFITFEGQRRDPVHPALRLLRQHRHLVTLLLWKPGSVAPSSEFWKELQLALPRKVRHRALEGDPQTRLQGDKDPMLIVQGHLPEGRTLHLELDPDPEGDLGVRGPIFGEPSAPPHASGVALGEGRGSEVDVSDLGSRNYSARTDFYCLVSEDDV